MRFRRRTDQEKLEKFGTTKAKDYAEDEAIKGMLYANELRTKYPFIKYIPIIVAVTILILIMTLG